MNACGQQELKSSEGQYVARIAITAQDSVADIETKYKANSGNQT
ncbi:MAG: hypothetical protein R2865_16215 [Deinococcales bacterium]